MLELMRKTPLNLTDDISENSPIRVTVLYENLEAGLRARELMDCVQGGLQLPTATLELEFWRFDWLAERIMRNVALSMAKRSTLVVFSFTNINSVPPELERWLNAWTRYAQPAPSALIALRLGAEIHRPGQSVLHDRLQRAAEQKGMDFFCEFIAAPASRPVARSSATRGMVAPRSKQSVRVVPQFGPTGGTKELPVESPGIAGA